MQSARKSVNQLRKTDAETSCVKNSRLNQLINTSLMFSHRLHIHTQITCSHTDYIFTHRLHIHTQITCSHTDYIFTHRLHIHTQITCSHTDYIFTHRLQVVSGTNKK